jgi:biopolymer transport protein ExbD
VADLDLELPEARTHAFGEETHVNVTLGRDGRLAIDDDIVVDATFIDGLRAKLAEEPNALVVIRADAGAPYGAVRTVLRDARAAGGTRLAIAARPAKAEAQ